MCICIPQNQQTIVFTFKDSRDFNVAIYTLKKFGLRVTDSVLPTSHTTSASLTRSQSCSVPSSIDFGPRLSSITPLQRHGSSQAPSPFSFTALLNSDVPLSQIPSMGTQYEEIQPPSPQSSQQPIHNIVPTTYVQNPYHLFLGQYGNMYQPRVSSPLRNAVEVDSRDLSPMSPISPIPQYQPSPLVHPEISQSLLTYQSTSAPSTMPGSRYQPRCTNTDDFSPPYSQQSPLGSQESNITYAESDTQSTDGTDISNLSQTAEDFRKLMPQPRNLPFLKESAAKTVERKSVKRRAMSELGSASAMQQSSFSADQNNRDTPDIDSKLCVRGNVSSAESDMDDASAVFKVLRPTSPQTRSAQSEATSPVYSSLETRELPPMLIADDALLKQINDATSRLLDQFTADVNRGCDGGACAQFYLDQIDMVRRDIWFSHLTQW